MLSATGSSSTSPTRRSARSRSTSHDDSPEIRYLQERRKALGGYLPQPWPHRGAARRAAARHLPVPARRDGRARDFDDHGVRSHPGSAAAQDARPANRADRRRRVAHLRDGGMFRQLGIYSHVGQLYEPEDAGQLMFYREDQEGQVLQEGITEAGAFSSWIAAATSYSNHDVQMLPFFLFYSMFGFQRVGDLAWRSGDSRARGFCWADRGAYDPGRGGAPARGRPQPRALPDRPELHLLRPRLCVRARGDRPRRPAPHGVRAGRRLLLPDDHERELSAPTAARRRRGGHSPRHAPGPRDGRGQGAAARLGDHPARGRGGG